MKISKLPIAFLGLLLFCINVLSAQNEVSEREVIALLEFKVKTKGHLWTNKWDQNKPISTWHGVVIENGSVVGLDLSDNNLQGKIPITIANLKNLKYLKLSGNNIKGRIPGLIRKLTHLQEVDLAKNQFVGNIPSAINKLQKLSMLNLSNNNLEGELPSSISQLPKLNTLDLANNNFTGSIPLGMENLKKLKKLYLANNEFNNTDNLRNLSKQQLVMTDVKFRDGELLKIDFTKPKEGLSKLEFSDYEN